MLSYPKRNKAMNNPAGALKTFQNQLCSGEVEVGTARFYAFLNPCYTLYNEVTFQNFEITKVLWQLSYREKELRELFSLGEDYFIEYVEWGNKIDKKAYLDLGIEPPEITPTDEVYRFSSVEELLKNMSFESTSIFKGYHVYDANVYNQGVRSLAPETFLFSETDDSGNTLFYELRLATRLSSAVHEYDRSYLPLMLPFRVKGLEHLGNMQVITKSTSSPLYDKVMLYLDKLKRSDTSNTNYGYMGVEFTDDYSVEGAKTIKLILPYTTVEDMKEYLSQENTTYALVGTAIFLLRDPMVVQRPNSIRPIYEEERASIKGVVI